MEGVRVTGCEANAEWRAASALEHVLEVVHLGQLLLRQAPVLRRRPGPLDSGNQTVELPRYQRIADGYRRADGVPLVPDPPRGTLEPGRRAGLGPDLQLAT